MMPYFKGHFKKAYPLIAFCIFFSLISFCANAQLKQIYIDGDKDVDVRKFSMYSLSEGFVAFNQFIGFTTDTGRTFTKRFVLNSNIDYNGYPVNITFGFSFEGIKAFDKNNIIVYGNYGLVPAILTSKDGGNTFKVVYHSQHRTIPGSSITDMEFGSNGLTGYAVDYDHIIKTVDGGQTWTNSATYNNAYFSSVQILNSSRIVAYSIYAGQQKLVASSDGGATWSNIALPAGIFKAAYFLSANIGWAATFEGNLYKTTNGGGRWSLQNTSPASYIQATKLVFEDELTGYALTNSLEVYKTIDGGKVWERLKLLSNLNRAYNIFDIQLRANQLWAGGINGFIALSTAKGGFSSPLAMFAIDESGVANGGMVMFNNYGKTGNSYKWIKNGKLFNTAYNASYLPNISAPNDTIKLIASNALYVDSATKITTFSKAPRVTGFSPTTAKVDYLIKIYGSNFTNVTGVSFGGVAARSFKVVSVNTIEATLQKRTLSGEVKVTTTIGSAALKGFIFIAPPRIRAVEPMAAIAGTKVIIKGSNFADVYEFRLAGSHLNYKITSDTTAEFVLDQDARSGNIVVSNSNYSVGSDTLQGFRILPVITSMSPVKGHYNSTIVLSGTGFSTDVDVLSVTIDGHPVRSMYKPYSGSPGSQLSVVAGEGGAAGVIKITTKGGSYELPGFTYYQTPQIDALSSYNGAADDVISITGKNFSGNTTEMFVYFGAVRAEIVSAGSQRIDVKIPPGATYEPVTVRTNGMVCYSPKPFILTFKGGGSINAKSFGAREGWYHESFSYKLKVADIDNDGRPDIIQPYYHSNQIVDFTRNASAPGKIATKSYSPIDRLGTSKLMDGAVSDFDQDGKLDYMTTDFRAFTRLGFKDDYSMSYSIFWEPAYHVSSYETIGLQYFSITDLDKDGNIDLVNGLTADIDNDGFPDAVSYDGNTMRIRRNIGSKGKPKYSDTVLISVEDFIQDIAIGDIDSDGLPDLVVGTQNGAAIAYRNTSTTAKVSFVQMSRYPVGQASSVNPVLGDLDGDGRIEMVLNSRSHDFLIYKNLSGTGTFSFADPVRFSNLALSGGRDCKIVDMDGDGKPDLVGSGWILRNLINTPDITSFTPDGGEKNIAVTISGGDFTGTSAVTFGGVNAKSFIVNTPNSITAVVDSGASGYIALTTPQGTGNSVKPFKFLSIPKIIAIDKAAFYQGDSATLATVGDDAYTYQWYKNGVAIDGANTSNYRAKQTANYTVTISYGNSVKLTSEPFYVSSIIKIAEDNFQISATNLACRGKKDGTLTIAADATMNYTANINGINHAFTKNLALNALEAGSYRICISIADVPDYSQCFTVEITQPGNFFAVASVNALRDSVKLNLNGGDIYFINLNGKKITTAKDNITLPLGTTLNTIEVSTDKECQGVFKESISGSTKILAYPNPFTSTLNINIGTETVKLASVSIADIQTGYTVLTENFFNRRGSLQIDTQHLPQKIYVLTLMLDGKKYIYKITK